jgi:hypothetical protein
MTISEVVPIQMFKGGEVYNHVFRHRLLCGFEVVKKLKEKLTTQFEQILSS